MAEQPKKKADLKELDLATGIDRLPELWNRYGNQVLIGLTVLALAYALWTFRRNSAESARITSEINLAQARALLNELRTQPLSRLPDDTYASLRRSAYAEASTALAEVLGRGADDTTVAQALLLQGDLNYLMAMLPDPPAAATRPTMGLDRKPDELQTLAQQSYQKILDSYASDPAYVAPARLGLAAIAENTGDFAAAKTQYQAVADDASAAPALREHAKQRLEILPDLARPMRIRTAPATTLPTTAPATTRP